MAPNVNNDLDGFFNDLSRQPTSEGFRGSDISQEQFGSHANSRYARTSRMKRTACVICRKRKLKCDGNKPKCATCARLGHNCEYDEARRLGGSKRGYVAELEARLVQLETQLKIKDNENAKSSEPGLMQGEPGALTSMEVGMQFSVPEGSFESIPTNDRIMSPGTAPGMMLDEEIMANLDLGLDTSFSWEMISQGVEEPMPTQEAVDELTSVYFDKIHSSIPMIHRYRYQASMDLFHGHRPPICLRYIMWCHSATVTDKYMDFQDIFYRRARKYAEVDEMTGRGEAFVSLAHAQCWSLIATYEFKMMYFPRAWMSVGRAARLVLMMGLNRVDGVSQDVKQSLPPPRDWTEREERKKTFWMAYCIDRYASMATGWPMSIDEKDISNTLPVSEDAFEQCRPEEAPTLIEAMTPALIKSLSSFAGVVLTAHFFGLIHTHLHRPAPDLDLREHDLNGEFWQRHQRIDTLLSYTSISLPDHLRLPNGIRDPKTVFLNLTIPTSTIRLHQAAIFKAEEYHLPTRVLEQSRSRCIIAAQRIADIMRMTSDIDMAGMNPFIAFCLFIAARVFVQYLKKAPGHQEIFGHLDFLLAALRALQRKIALTELFSIQLNLDIEGSGLYTMLRAPAGFDTAINGNINGSGLFTDVSGQTTRSSRLTPQSTASYSHVSPNLSYPPPQMQDEDLTTTQATTRVGSMQPIAGAHNSFTAFSPPTDHMFAASGSSSGSGLGSASTPADGNGSSNPPWMH